MTDTDAQLAALTNQRVPVTLGGVTYQARRATLKDFATINRHRAEKVASSDTANLEVDVALFTLSELLKPDINLSPDQLAERIPLEDIFDLNDALETLGFKLPQEKKATAA